MLQLPARKKIIIIISTVKFGVYLVPCAPCAIHSFQIGEGGNGRSLRICTLSIPNIRPQVYEYTFVYKKHASSQLQSTINVDNVVYGAHFVYMYVLNFH